MTNCVFKFVTALKLRFSLNVEMYLKFQHVFFSKSKGKGKVRPRRGHEGLEGV